MKSNKYQSFLDTNHLEEEMKLRTIKGGMITTTSQGVLFFLRLTSIVILARMIIPDHFGLIGMVTALTVLIERFQDIGLSDAVIQRKNITHEQVSTLFWINMAICIFFTIVVLLAAKSVAWFYHDKRLVWITIAFALNFAFSGLVIQHIALLRRRMQFGYLSFINIISTFIGIFVALILAWHNFGYWALVWKQIATSIAIFIFTWVLCPWRPGPPSRHAEIKSLLRFGVNITGSNMLFYFSRNFDSILLGKFFGPFQVGLYTKAAQLTAIPGGLILEPAKSVILPVLSTLQNDPVAYSRYFYKILSVVNFIYMPLTVYIGIYSYPIVNIALGSQWMAAVPIFRLLAISSFTYPIVMLLGMVLLSSGQGRKYFYWGLFTNLLTIFCFILCIKWASLGIAISWSISTILNFIFSLIFVFKNSPISMIPTFNNLYKPVTASIVMGAVLLLTYNFIAAFNLALQMVISILLGCMIYFTLWLLFPGGYKNIIEFISYPLTLLKKNNSDKTLMS